MKRALTFCFVAVLCAVLTACGGPDEAAFQAYSDALAKAANALQGSPKEAAFRAFSETWSCPRNRITVTAIEGVTMRELWLRANPLPEPPVELRDDPERLAVWRATQDKAREGPLEGVVHAHYELFHVRGCEHAVDYACYCPSQQKGAIKGGGPLQNFCGCEAPPALITQESTP